MRIRAPQAERGLDHLYETSPVAVQALLRAEPLPTHIWEPASGPGAIARVLRAAGHQVLATDVVDYKSPDQDHAAGISSLSGRSRKASRPSSAIRRSPLLGPSSSTHSNFAQRL
jgi:hypothetical protein